MSPPANLKSQISHNMKLMKIHELRQKRAFKPFKPFKMFKTKERLAA